MNPALKVWYYAGGRLPLKYKQFVYDDVTGPKWLLRFTVRSLVQVTPLTTVIALALVFGLGSSWPLAIACGGLGFVVGLYFALSYAPESVDHRLTKYGYPRGSATHGRRERNAAQDREKQAKYDAVWRRSEG
ncbi:DUF5313 family protein [Lentzea jiangxiensis]|uniref:DUF5313 domain-containing protein n=1 Tax=Lentzea jiangxiensis TaxID=641025 RepID=A0A1H0R4Q3_9PSEU|nr:DUF5313 family protein [Lentzea jiangxiensis]SDP24501.1 hypothetical protein SAMN05421507_106159 [Lentzea jiangxiensis]